MTDWFALALNICLPVGGADRAGQDCAKNEDIENKPGQATPESEVYRQLIDPNIAKSEMGWFAKRRIEQLEALCHQLAEACKETKTQIEFSHKTETGYSHWTPIHSFIESVLDDAKKAGISNG